MCQVETSVDSSGMIMSKTVWKIYIGMNPGMIQHLISDDEYAGALTQCWWFEAAMEGVLKLSFILFRSRPLIQFLPKKSFIDSFILSVQAVRAMITENYSCGNIISINAIIMLSCIITVTQLQLQQEVQEKY